MNLGSPYTCPTCEDAVDAESVLCTTCKEPRPRGGWPLDSRVGRVVLERYRLTKKIGRGASSEVFLAIDERLPSSAEASKVVVKVLSGLASESERKRFLNEVRAVRELRNPGVVKVYDAGFSGVTPCIVMEYLEGETLRAHMSRPLSDAESLTIAEQIATAMTEAHQKGILHRDLKPENVFLQGTTVKVLDFGAATFDDATGTQSNIGTPRYMAPEQMLPSHERTGALDARVDIYALGVILYEMLARRSPFEADSLEQLLKQKLMSVPEPLGGVRKGTSRALSEFVMSLLAQSPSGRPESMSIVADQLRNFTHGVAATPMASSPKQRTAWFVVGGIAIIGVLGAIAATSSSAMRPVVYFHAELRTVRSGQPSPPPPDINRLGALREVASTTESAMRPRGMAQSGKVAQTMSTPTVSTPSSSSSAAVSAGRTGSLRKDEF
jgi:serine/threonine protein kinase